MADFLWETTGSEYKSPFWKILTLGKSITFFSVSNFEKKAGVLVFRIIPEPKFGNTELTIYFEEGCYLPMIQTILEDGDIGVKNLKTENYSGNTMEIWGDFYPIEHISKNISTIQNIISEFMIQKQTPAPII